MNLRWFRKHQKGMLVVFGAVLMAVFGLGGVVSMIDPSRGQRSKDANEVVVEWKNGEFTRGQLRDMLTLHYQAFRFIVALDNIKRKEQGINYKPTADIIQPIQTEISPEYTDIQLVNRVLLAEKAKELGIQVGDQEVNDYIQSFAIDRLSETELKKTNDEVNKGDVDMGSIRRQIKMELLSRKMQQFLGLGLYQTPGPTDAYDSWAKMRREIDCQVLAFPVKNYKVSGSPSDDQISELFAEGQDEFPDPLNTKPGFKLPRRLVIEYFVADYTEFLEREKAKVTMEELKSEYDRWVENRDRRVIVNEEEKKKKENDLSLPGEGKKDDGKSADKSGKTDGKNPANKGDSKKVDPVKPADGKPADSKSDGEKKSDDKNKQSLNANPREVFTSLQDKKQDSKKQDSAPKQDSKKAETSKKDGKQDSKQGGGKQDGKKADDDKAPKPAGKQDPADDNSKKQETPKEVKFKKIDEVAELIKESLKATAAREAMNDALAKATEDILIYMQEYEIWQSTKEADDEAVKPERPDFRAIAAKYRLHYRFTLDPESISEELNKDPKKKAAFIQKQCEDDNNKFAASSANIVETEIGGLEEVNFGFANGRIQQNRVKLGRKIFSGYHGMKLYDGKKFVDGNKTYIYWTSSKLDSTTVSLDTARPAVVKFWRKLQAQKEAKEAAEKFASTVNTRKVPLISIDAKNAKNTGAFKWFMLNSQGGISYGEPQNVKKPAESFMQKAFSLDELDAGVAANETKEVYYVVQVIKKVPTLDNQPQSRLFMNHLLKFQRLPPGMTQVNQRYSGKAFSIWADEFNKEMGVKWLAY